MFKECHYSDKFFTSDHYSTIEQAYDKAIDNLQAKLNPPANFREQILLKRQQNRTKLSEDYKELYQNKAVIKLQNFHWQYLLNQRKQY